MGLGNALITKAKDTISQTIKPGTISKAIKEIGSKVIESMDTYSL